LRRERDVPGEERNYRGTIGIETPIFSGFGNAYAVVQAESEALAAQERVKSFEVRVTSEVWGSFFAVESAERRVGAAQALLKAADESFRVLNKGYEAGANAFLDVLAAQAEVARARRSVIEAQTEFAVAIARLALASGQLPEVMN
jgi:outer membrane protein TolC